MSGILRLAGIASGIAALAGGCSPAEKEAAVVATVQVTPAIVAPITLTITSDAVLAPLQQAIITPKITSTIKKFYVQRGSHVKEGQLLATLENADLAAAAEQSKGEFEEAEAGYDVSTGASIPQDLQKAELDAATAKINLDAQQKVYDGRKELFQEGALPRRDLDAAEVALSQARNQYEVAKRALEDRKRLGQTQALKSASGQLAAAKGKYLAAQAALKYSEIRSPMDGVVTDRPQFEGELATANQPLLTVMNISKLVAKLHVAQAEAAPLKVGVAAEMSVEGVPEPVPAKVSLVSPALDPGSTTVEVWVESAKANSALKAGITVRVSIAAQRVNDALVVPASAVFKNADGADFVMVAGADNKAKQQIVQVGIRTATLAQITGGLKAGDKIISSGGYALPDGTAIKVEEAGGDKSPSSGAKEDDDKKDDAGAAAGKTKE